MRCMNKVLLVGRVGQEPELRQGRSGLPWASMRVATNRSRKQDGAWVEETDWHDIRVFGGSAEACHRRIRRGSLVSVEGTLTYDAWTDDKGVRRRTPRVLADRVGFLSDLRESPTAAAETPAAVAG